MNQSKESYTKGPWIFKQFKDYRVHFSIVVQSYNGDSICKMLRSDSPSDDIQEANARLIAAAPEMIFALQKCVDSFECLQSVGRELGSTEVYAFELAKEAIKKAKGN